MRMILRMAIAIVLSGAVAFAAQAQEQQKPLPPLKQKPRMPAEKYSPRPVQPKEPPPPPETPAPPRKSSMPARPELRYPPWVKLDFDSRYPPLIRRSANTAIVLW
jgi:hypothetical protein